MEIKQIILVEMNRILRQDGIPEVAEVDDLTKLEELGLDSLGYAILISNLEEMWGVDPFSSGHVTQYPETFGEFANLYRQGNLS